MWSWFHRLGSPRWFYHRSTVWLPWLAVATGLTLILGLVWGLAFAPPDFRQGNSFRIVYIHVPAATVAMAGYMVMATAGGIALIWRMKLAAMVMRCGAALGAALQALALFTAAVCGTPTWAAGGASHA